MPPTSPVTARPTQNMSQKPSSVQPKRPTSQPTSKPTIKNSMNPCGDGNCHPQQNEDPQTCPADCTTEGLTLASSSNKAARAVMFTATALQSLSITSLSFTAKKSAESLVEIYTLVGDYSGNENNEDAWTLCYSREMELVKDQLTTITDLNCPNTLDVNDKRSFLVFAKNGLLLQEEGTASSNAKLMANNGIFMKKKFDKAKGDALMTGRVK